MWEELFLFYLKEKNINHVIMQSSRINQDYEVIASWVNIRGKIKGMQNRAKAIIINNKQKPFHTKQFVIFLELGCISQASKQ